MKKLFIAIGIATMMALASCSNSTETSVDDSTILDTLTIDSCTKDSICKDSCSKDSVKVVEKTVGAK
jgi:hypothetical protein